MIDRFRGDTISFANLDELKNDKKVGEKMNELWYDYLKNINSDSTKITQE